jgi:3-hydroxyisobutyrate dehydrogenase-like beta-hydroxyacid dehydrogenase
MKDMKIGFVGTGRMGANMARRLADLGYSICAVYDPHGSIVASLAFELNCFTAKSLPEVTAACDVIFTVVTDEDAMREIFSGEESLLLGSAGRVFINCATVGPEVHEFAAEAAEKAGAFALAACMASSIPQARQGLLYLIVGGQSAVYERMRPLLEDISASLRYVGGVGEAAKVKALVNMVMNINTAGLAEGLGLGAAVGLDLQMLKEVFSQTGANSRVLETDGDDMINRDHDCYFSAAHAAKDSGIANTLAGMAGVSPPLSRATEVQYRKMIELGLGGLDKSGIAEITFPNRMAGVAAKSGF